VLLPSDDLLPFSDEELACLPVFPLPSVVLLPGSVLPLHVYEPRYRAMIRDCLSEGPRALAMAMLAPGWERDYEGRPTILAVAGAGRIVAHRRNPDGTYDLVIQGVSRVRLEELPAGAVAYRRARATVLADGRAEDIAALRRAIEPLLATATSLAAMERAAGRAVPVHEPIGAPARVVDRLADRWVRDVALRQRILETTDVPQRIALVGDALATTLALLSKAHGGRAGHTSTH
jgi:Lon protease-like protein